MVNNFLCIKEKCNTFKMVPFTLHVYTSTLYQKKKVFPAFVIYRFSKYNGGQNKCGNIVSPVISKNAIAAFVVMHNYSRLADPPEIKI